ncbi:MAG: glycosyltransferase family 39 protein [Legionellaceae bacterium]|nr:glycosyltransferase family 39 protein [Legionellaceae bacterium]
MFLNNVDNSTSNLKFVRNVALVLLFLLITRLVSMYFVPLNDSTEARYAEIARIMLETGNWVTPMHHYGVPFWAKPPLSTWLSASSMKYLGVNELGARLPGLILSLGILWMVWRLAKRQSGPQVAMMSVLVLAGSIYFFLDAGTVMTDPSLLFCTTLTLIAFWRAITYQSRLWGYVFFSALGLGLLAKGPIALVLTGMPIFVWVLRHNRWMDLWRHLPWILGGLLMLLIALPWYLLAESKTPGFLNYFIVGEHIKRFLQPGWRGDKYGFAHMAPYGMIWVYALIGIFPWSIPGGIWLARHLKSVRGLCQDDDGWVSYLLLCTLVPLVFFTFARNIIYPYVFPSLPTFALLFAELAHRSQLSIKNQQKLVPYAAITGILFLGVTAVFVAQPELIAKSQNRVVDVFKQQQPSVQSHLVYWLFKTDYSAEFYSAGRAKATLDAHDLCVLLSNRTSNYVVLDSEENRKIPEDILAQLTEISVVPVMKKQFTIYRADAIKCV